jgi:hypothetical protein
MPSRPRARITDDDARTPHRALVAVGATDDVETIALDDVDVAMTSETSLTTTGTTETVPHDKSPRDAPMTKTIARGGDDGARVVPLGATCYGACAASFADRSREGGRDEGDENAAREWAD